jgi:hypothetical protein
MSSGEHSLAPVIAREHRVSFVERETPGKYEASADARSALTSLLRAGEGSGATELSS